MKELALLTIITIFYFSCDTHTPKPVEKDNSLPMKVAYSYGLDNFDTIKDLHFKFNVETPNRKFSRAWKWNMKTANVEMRVNNETTQINLNEEMDSSELKVYHSFINDTYWLLFPFHLAWAKGNYIYQVTENVASPLDSIPSTQMTVYFHKEDGFTPGDAYILYLNDKNEIIEWNFKKENKKENNSYVRWAKPISIEGIKIHESFSREDFRLFFTELSFIRN